MKADPHPTGFNYFRLLMWLCLGLGLASRVSAQGTFYPLMVNGAVSNRLNIVILAEGYTTNQQAKFLSDATNAVNNFFNYEPYQEYRNYCNAYAVFVASNQSGSDHPQYPSTSDTYFNSTYDATFNYIITIPTDATGQGKVNSLLQTWMPRTGLPVMLVNDLSPGGSGGPICITSYGGLVSQPSIIIHESGHTLGKLGDEYNYGYSDFSAYTGAEAPNTTQQTQRNLIKWDAWISPSTPIPTEESDLQYVNDVGLFQGANYHATGWYRPSLQCIMTNINFNAFCPVCSETMVKAIYTNAQPIDAFSPTNNTAVQVTSAQTFSVTPLQPATHSLSVQWFTNGTAIAGATNANYLLSPQNIPGGTYTLQAQVRDLTPLVRTDPQNLLSNSVSWTVNVNELQADRAQWLAGGKFTFRLSGNAPHGFVVQGSTNLSNWTPLLTNTLASGQFFYTNSSLGALSHRFYRAQLLP